MSSGPARRGGILLRIEGALRFLPASAAVRVVSAPRPSPVPGAPPELLGIALYESVVLPVIAVGGARGDMAVCQHAGDLVGLVGGEVVKTGTFDVVADRPDLIEYEGERAAPLDVSAIYARVQTAARSARWGG